MLIATRQWLYTVDDDTSDKPPERVLAADGIEAVEEGRRIGVAALAGGDLAVVEAGATRRVTTHIPDPAQCLALLREEPLDVLIGTEPPHLYRLEGELGPARRVSSFDELPCREEWYTPWGGPAAVRSLARSGDWVFADIHVGSIMRSPDLGTSWEPVTPDLHEDVHQVATSPTRAGRVYANTAAAVYLSDDCGRTWTHRSDGLSPRYGRAAAVHPQDSDCILATVSRGPHGEVDGKLVRSDDAGRTWSHVTDGFPAATRDNIDTFQVGFSPSGAAWAAVEATLYRSSDRGAGWEAVWEAPEPIALLACGAG